MKVELIEYKNVGPDGELPSGGAIEVKPIISMSSGEGCGFLGCNCSDGFWVTIGEGKRADGTVRFMKVTFTDKKEYNKFMKAHELKG